MDLEIDLHTLLSVREVQLRFNREAAERSLSCRIIPVETLRSLDFLGPEELRRLDADGFLTPHLNIDEREEDVGFIEDVLGRQPPLHSCDD